KPPLPIAYNAYLCDQCPFNHLCGVEEFSGSAEMGMVSDPEVKELVENYFFLKEAEEKFEIVKEDLKSRFSGKNVQVGDDYKILSRLVEVKPDPEPKPRKGYKYWTMKILKL
ncbi:hypothetical protein KKB18_02100, partial [bacterium]|nr:hypothetical protein [bacterium]